MISEACARNSTGSTEVGSRFFHAASVGHVAYCEAKLPAGCGELTLWEIASRRINQEVEVIPALSNVPTNSASFPPCWSCTNSLGDEFRVIPAALQKVCPRLSYSVRTWALP